MKPTATENFHLHVRFYCFIRYGFVRNSSQIFSNFIRKWKKLVGAIAYFWRIKKQLNNASVLKKSQRLLWNHTDCIQAGLQLICSRGLFAPLTLSTSWTFWSAVLFHDNEFIGVYKWKIWPAVIWGIILDKKQSACCLLKLRLLN